MGSGDRVQTRLIFYSLYCVVTLKIRITDGRYMTEILLLLRKTPTQTNIKFGQNTSFGSSDRGQTSFFGQNLAFKVLVCP